MYEYRPGSTGCSKIASFFHIAVQFKKGIYLAAPCIRRRTLISAYLKDEMSLKMNKASEEWAKPEAVYDYNFNIGAIQLKDEML
jgi:hypothetical protein